MGCNSFSLGLVDEDSCLFGVIWLLRNCCKVKWLATVQKKCEFIKVESCLKDSCLFGVRKVLHVFSLIPRNCNRILDWYPLGRFYYRPRWGIPTFLWQHAIKLLHVQQIY